MPPMDRLAASLDSTAMSAGDLARRSHHKRFKSEDLRLLERAQSSSCSLNKIAEGNFLKDDLLTSIDGFIASIERKLDRVESFFGSGSDVDRKLDDDDSVATLQNLYDTLITIKNSVFGSAFNMETFNTILDEHYGGLLSSIEASENLGFHERLLTALHFLDAKINEFNNMVEMEAKYLMGDEIITPLSTDAAIKTFEIKFHNYEHAIREGASRHLHFYELPFPWRENPYIIEGYRFQNNHLHALKSVCSCHNETTNIWTHLIGAMIFVYIAFVSFPNTPVYANNTFKDNCIIYFFFAASFKCLISSAFWHAFNGTANLYLRRKFACIDYTGITVLITASCITSEYATLYYHPWLQTGFISFSLLCGIFGFFFNWSSYFDHPKSKPFRIGFYICLAGLGISAFVFLAFEKGLVHALTFYVPITRSCIWYLTGVGFYASLIPEKFRTDIIIDEELPEESELITPKVTENLHLYFKENPQYTEEKSFFRSMWWVDYIFASHNIWHVFVLLGVLGHWAATYEMFSNIPFNK
jgi:adiponectin receptor